jgi:hypothetical protein
LDPGTKLNGGELYLVVNLEEARRQSENPVRNTQKRDRAMRCCRRLQALANDFSFLSKIFKPKV